MTLLLPDNPDLSLLKKQAKKLLRAFQQQQAQALTTVAAWHPAPHTFQSLRDAQLVVARSSAMPVGMI